MAIAHFMGTQTLAALPLARAPVLVFKADLQPQPEAVPSDSGLTSDSESGCHSQAQAVLTTVWRKPEARATLKLPFKFKVKLR